MSGRVDFKLQESGAGKYMASILLTQDETKETIRVITRELGRYRSQKRDMNRTGVDRTRIAKQAEYISLVLSYLYEALAVLKKAQHARNQGRYELNKTMGSAPTQRNRE